jgi:hypothetical protein
MHSNDQRQEPDVEGVEWEYLHSMRSLLFRRRLKRTFKKFFPKGHRTSLRPLVTEIAQSLRDGETFSSEHPYRHMNDVHVDALEMIVKYGMDYTPLIWKQVLPRPEKGGCFWNSWLLAKGLEDMSKENGGKGGPFMIVEGIVFGSVVRPMGHAWNAQGLRGNIAIDWTHYTVCQWSRYLGIPMTLAEHEELRHLTSLGSNVRLLFHKKYFAPHARDRLISILEARNL